MASYFFASDEMVIHSREAFNITKLISEFGGFALFIIRLVYALGWFMNNRLLFAKFIRTTYLIEDTN